MPYLDIPFQHAAPNVLKAMKRPGNDEKTLERIRAWREACPDLALRSTFIVGFPGETEEDFDYLLDWLEEAEIDRAGAFRYEPVAGAPANALALTAVPAEVKETRWKRFMESQQKVSARLLKRKIGKRLRPHRRAGRRRIGALATGRSKADAPQIDGAAFIASRRPLRAGDIVTVKIERSEAYDVYRRGDLEPPYIGAKDQIWERSAHDRRTARRGLAAAGNPADDAREAPTQPQLPKFVIPRSLYIATALIVIGSFAITLFVRNPYTQSVPRRGFYEHSTDSSALMWVAIFVGIPLSFWAYKRWISAALRAQIAEHFPPKAKPSRPKLRQIEKPERGYERAPARNSVEERSSSRPVQIDESRRRRLGEHAGLALGQPRAPEIDRRLGVGGLERRARPVDDGDRRRPRNLLPSPPAMELQRDYPRP